MPNCRPFVAAVGLKTRPMTRSHRAMGTGFSNANIGVACGAASGIIVIDIDPRNGGMETFRSLRKRGLEFPPTVAVSTPSGGIHAYYRYHPDVKGTKNPLGAGIDIQTDGKYVVAPASHIGEQKYTWRKSPLGVNFPPLPSWAIKKLIPRPVRTAFHEPYRGDHGNLAGPIHYLENMTQGDRNMVLHWCGCRAGEAMRKGQLSEAEAMQQLIAAAHRVGLEPKEIVKTIKSGIRKGIEGRR